MKAAVLYGNQDIRYEEWPEPKISSGMVKVRVKACWEVRRESGRLK